MTIEERHNSLTRALKEVEGTIKGRTDFTPEDRKKLKEISNITKKITKKRSGRDKFLKIVYKLTCIMFPISLLFSFVMVYQGNWQIAWTYMFIALMNAGVVFDGSLNK